MSEKEQEIKVILNGKEILSYVSVINKTLSPETIEIIQIMFNHYDVDEATYQLKEECEQFYQAQEEFNAVYGDLKQ